MPLNNIGNIIRFGNMMQASNALVEEVFLQTRTTGSVTISYSSKTPDGITFINLLQLNVHRNTVILNSLGRTMCLCDIHKGMWVDAIFSPITTRSIPPQSNAFLLLVRSGSRPSSTTSTGRIVSVDTENRSITTGIPGDINRQTVFIITDNTIIRNRAGSPVRLSNLRPGQTVRIVHSNAQTASIPPQTTAFYVQVI